MLNKAKISFSTYNRSHVEARNAADMILMTDSLENVITAVSKSRQYKDHLLKFVLLQIPASITAIAMVLSQVFLYQEILVTACFIFLVNLIYFPCAIACLVRENSASNQPAMMERWRSHAFPGAKTVSSYMKSEYLKFTVTVVIIYQIAVLAGLYFERNRLFGLIGQEIIFNVTDQLFIDQEWLDANPAIADRYEVYELTQKG